MRKLKIYLDTSIINFLLVEDAPDYRKETERLFEDIISKDIMDVYISNVVIEELNNTKDILKKNRLFGILKKYPNIKKILARYKYFGRGLFAQ